MSELDLDLDFDREIRDALKSVTLPPEVKSRTLDAIKLLGAQEEQSRQNQSQGKQEGCSSEEDRSSKRVPQVTTQSASQAAPQVASQTKPQTEPQTTTTPQVKVIKSRRKAAARRIAAIAACLIVALVGVVGFRAATIPTAFVDIDVNPSIELTLNRFGYVLEQNAINDDGAAVLSSTSVVGKSYSDAIDSIANSEIASGFLKQDSFMAFSITSDNDNQAKRLVYLSDACIERVGCMGSSSIADAQTRDKAREYGMGTARYVAACELVEIDPTLTIEKCSQMPMSQIVSKIIEIEGSGGNSSQTSSNADAASDIEKLPSENQPEAPSSDDKANTSNIITPSSGQGTIIELPNSSNDTDTSGESIPDDALTPDSQPDQPGAGNTFDPENAEDIDEDSDNDSSEENRGILKPSEADEDFATPLERE